MRSITSTFFECKVRYSKTLENGLEKKVTEVYVVDALSWAEAEARMTEEMKAFGEFEIMDIKKAAYKEIFISDESGADIWYRAKVQFITIDEKTEQEKKQNVYYLTNASNIEEAKKGIDEIFASNMTDYSVSKLEETAILEFFEHREKTE